MLWIGVISVVGYCKSQYIAVKFTSGSQFFGYQVMHIKSQHFVFFVLAQRIPQNSLFENDMFCYYN